MTAFTANPKRTKVQVVTFGANGKATPVPAPQTQAPTAAAAFAKAA